MAVNDFTGKNIQDTYQRVVQTDGTNLADGTGSLLPISFEGNDVIIPGALRAESYIVSESIIVASSGSTRFGNSGDDTHFFTGSLQLNGTGVNGFGFRTTGDRRFLDIGTANFSTLNGGTDYVLRIRTTVDGDKAIGGDVFGDLHIKNFGAAYSNGNLITEGEITSSGNISSSGFILGGELRSAARIFSNDRIVGYNTSTINFLADSNAPTHIDGVNIELDAPVTASIISSSGFIQSNIIRGSIDEPTGLIVSGYIQAAAITSSGTITATGNISSSGTIIANKIESDELVSRVGDANTGIQLASDTVQIEGNDTILANFTTTRIELNNPITASHDISSSGNIIGVKGQFSQIEIDGESALNTTDTTGQVFSDSQITKIEYGKAPTTSHFFHGAAITASGDISASGNIHTHTRLFIQDKEALDGSITDTSGNFIIGINENGEFPGGVIINRSTNPQPCFISGNITASAIISSSGKAVFPQYEIQNQTLAARHPQAGIQVGNNSDIMEIDGTNIILDAPVTASGNISASGDLTVNNINGTINGGTF